ncbi:uncharacterized protein VTP21DRAFT_3334 [Calcarisporiella thermophila]|uniref:uncharacterized protein n=1 Tax=Calcarisporiella thermophila TaxID=911321 RepID=UPI003743C6A2
MLTSGSSLGENEQGPWLKWSKRLIAKRGDRPFIRAPAAFLHTLFHFYLLGTLFLLLPISWTLVCIPAPSNSVADYCRQPALPHSSLIITSLFIPNLLLLLNSPSFGVRCAICLYQH